MRRRFVYWVIRFLLFFLCKTDWDALKAIPKDGPMILAGNHVNFLDAPLAYTYLYPRQVVSLVKMETFENPLLKFLFNTWGSIPVHRGTSDFSAFGKAVDVLKQGKFFAIFPEGTRTRDGCLIQGHPGITIVALKSDAPILPVVHFGTEDFHNNFKKLKRTKITFRIGEPFRISPSGPFPKREERQMITDEIMYQLAKILPEEYRGYYSDLSKATTQFLDFDVNK